MKFDAYPGDRVMWKDANQVSPQMYLVQDRVAMKSPWTRGYVEHPEGAAYERVVDHKDWCCIAQPRVVDRREFKGGWVPRFVKRASIQRWTEERDAVMQEHARLRTLQLRHSKYKSWCLEEGAVFQLQLDLARIPVLTPALARQLCSALYTGSREFKNLELLRAYMWELYHMEARTALPTFDQWWVLHRLERLVDMLDLKGAANG